MMEAATPPAPEKKTLHEELYSPNRRKRCPPPDFILARKAVFECIARRVEVFNPVHPASTEESFFAQGKKPRPAYIPPNMTRPFISVKSSRISGQMAKNEFGLSDQDLNGLDCVTDDYMESFRHLVSSNFYQVDDVRNLALKRQSETQAEFKSKQDEKFGVKVERVRKAGIIPSEIDPIFYDKVFGTYFEPSTGTKNLPKFSKVRKLAMSALVVQRYLHKSFWRPSVLFMFINCRDVYIQTHYPKRLYAWVAKAMRLSDMYLKVMNECFCHVHEYLDKKSLDNLVEAHNGHSYTEIIETYQNPELVRAAIVSDVTEELGNDGSWQDSLSHSVKCLLGVATRNPYDIRTGKAFAVRQLVYIGKTNVDSRTSDMLSLFQALCDTLPEEARPSDFETHMDKCKSFIAGHDLTYDKKHLAVRVFTDMYLQTKGTLFYEMNHRILMDKISVYMFQRKCDYIQACKKVLLLPLRDPALRRRRRFGFWDLFATQRNDAEFLESVGIRQFHTE